MPKESPLGRIIFENGDRVNTPTLRNIFSMVSPSLWDIYFLTSTETLPPGVKSRPKRNVCEDRNNSVRYRGWPSSQDEYLRDPLSYAPLIDLDAYSEMLHGMQSVTEEEKHERILKGLDPFGNQVRVRQPVTTIRRENWSYTVDLDSVMLTSKSTIPCRGEFNVSTS